MTTQARELASLVDNSGNVNLKGSISRKSDSLVQNFGADNDVTLTHVHNTGLILNSTRQLQFGDSGTYINQSADGVLNLTSDTEVEINATTVDINANVDVSGNIVLAGTITVGDADDDNMIINANVNSHIIPNTDDTFDLGSSGQQWRNLYINGTAEIDAITVGGVTLSETIADTVGAMTTSNTESGITVAYDDGDNTLDFTVATLNQDTTGTADNFTASANNSTDETVYPVFVDGATGSQGAETDTGLTYNPSSGIITATQFTGAVVGNVTGNASGSAATLASARTIGGTSFDGSANIAVNLAATATALASARTIHGVSFDGTANIDLSEEIADTVGAMVSSNTETNVTVTYEDGDNTLDFVIGTLNQDTTGLAGTATALASGRTIGMTGDVVWTSPSFDGSGNVTAAATIQTDAVDIAMLSASGTASSSTFLRGDNSWAAVSSSLTVGADSGSDDVVTVGTDTLDFVGTSNEIETTVSNNQIQIGLPNNVTISGNLTVSGDTVTVNTATLAVEDPLVSLATGNNAADAVDIGIYGLYDTSGSQDLYGGLFRDASDSGKWKLFKDNQAAPTTTVNTSGTGYAVGTLVGNLEGNVTGTASLSTLAATATALATARTIGGVSFDGTANIAVTLAATATALATGRTIGGTSFDGTANIVPATVTVADTTDTSSYVALFESATGDLGPKTDAAITYNAGTGALTATSFVGNITGNVTGNTSGTAATVTGGTQASITTVANVVEVGALDAGSITSGFGTIDTGSSAITTTGLISGGSLDIDDVLINGTTIGHTDDTDLMTLADGSLTVAGAIVGTGAITSLTNFNSTSGNDLRLNAGSANRDIFMQVNGTTHMTVQGSTGKVLIGTQEVATKAKAWAMQFVFG